MAQDVRQLQLEASIEIFKIPPFHDILVVGRKAPIGKNTFIKILDWIAPNQFVKLDILDSSEIEAFLVHRSLFNFLGEEALREIVMEEVEPMMEEGLILDISVRFRKIVKRTIDLGPRQWSQDNTETESAAPGQDAQRRPDGGKRCCWPAFPGGESPVPRGDASPEQGRERVSSPRIGWRWERKMTWMG